MKDALFNGIIQKIKDSVSILEVVGEHVVLKKSGANYTGLCPFHSERSPSFSVSETKKLYHCHGCKKGGDLIGFVMEMQGLSFLEAIEDLAERSQIVLPKNLQAKSDAETSEAKKKQALGFKLNRFVANFYHQELFSSEEATQYLQGRQMNQEMCRLFYLGSSPKGWDGLSVYLKKKAAPLDLAANLGLIRSNKLDSNFDLFHDRIIFPIVNLRGKIAGFGGRLYFPGVEGPKYLNSPESSLFQKSKLSFGLYQAHKYVREKDELIVVEGYFDVIAMHQHGFRNVVATCGTALTLDHLNSFQRLANRIILLFDGDEAGKKATERAMELGLEAGIILYGAHLPNDRDPDELLKSDGAERMAMILEESAPVVDQKIEEAISSAKGGPEAQVQALKRIQNWLSKLSDPIGREIRYQLVYERLGVSKSLLANQKSSSPKIAQSVRLTDSKKVTQEEKPSLPPMERILLLGIISGNRQYIELLEQASLRISDNQNPGEFFDHPDARSWVSGLFTDPGRLVQLRDSPSQALNHTMNPELREFLVEALLSPIPPVELGEFKSALLKKVSHYWTRFSKQLKSKMLEEGKREGRNDTHLMKEYLDVQRKIKEFINFYDKE